MQGSQLVVEYLPVNQLMENPVPPVIGILAKHLQPGGLVFVLEVPQLGRAVANSRFPHQDHPARRVAGHKNVAVAFEAIHPDTACPHGLGLPPGEPEDGLSVRICAEPLINAILPLLRALTGLWTYFHRMALSADTTLGERRPFRSATRIRKYLGASPS